MWFFEAMTEPLKDHMKLRRELSKIGGNVKEQLRTTEDPGGTETSAENPTRQEFEGVKNFL